jgi:hypothetical protein
MLKLDNGRLIGESNNYTFNFERATADYLAQLSAEKAAQEKQMFSFVKAGASYDGTFHSVDGQYAEKFRLTFKRIEQEGALIEAELYSTELPGIHAEMKGAVNLSDSQISMSRINGKINTGGYLHSPIFTQSYGTLTIDLNIAPDAVSGEIRDHQWKVDIPFTASASSPAGAAAQAATADPSAYPSAPGGYAWIDGKWVSLPHNNGHVTYAAKQVVAGVFGLLNSLSNKPSDAAARSPDKLADLTFDGTDLIPSADPAKIIIVFVGPIPPTPDDVLAKYPDYPVMEMAPSTTGSDNVRKAPLFRIVPGLGGFINTRVPAVVEKVSDAISTLTCTQQIPSGNYAITAGADAFELKVR